MFKDMTEEEVDALTEEVTDGLNLILICDFDVWLDDEAGPKIMGRFSYESIRMGESLSEIKQNQEAIDFLKSKGFSIKEINSYEEYNMMPDETVEYTTVYLDNVDVVKAFEHHSADPRAPYHRHAEERQRSEGIFPHGWRRPWHI